MLSHRDPVENPPVLNLVSALLSLRVSDDWRIYGLLLRGAFISGGRSCKLRSHCSETHSERIVHRALLPSLSVDEGKKREKEFLSWVSQMHNASLCCHLGIVRYPSVLPFHSSSSVYFPSHRFTRRCDLLWYILCKFLRHVFLRSQKICICAWTTKISFFSSGVQFSLGLSRVFFPL